MTWFSKQVQVQARTPGSSVMSPLQSRPGGQCCPGFSASLKTGPVHQGCSPTGTRAQGTGQVQPREHHSWLPSFPQGRLVLPFQQETQGHQKGKEPIFRHHSPRPKLFKFSRCEGNIGTIQRVLYVPPSEKAVALAIRFYKVLQHSERAMSDV